MDTSILGTLFKLAPDLMEKVELRALVLERVAALGPVGRRALAQRLHLAERDVRTAADALKEAGCILQNAAGMEITPQGRLLVDAARTVSRGRRSLSAMELMLSRMLNAQRVCIVPGDADLDSGVLAEAAKAAAEQLRFVLQDANVLAVSGGEAIAMTAQEMQTAAPMEITVVPAQGGTDGGVRTQANTIAEALARRLGGGSRMLYLPDGLSGQAVEEIARMPQVREALELLRSADVLLYGIGRAMEQAKHRGLSTEERTQLQERGAVAEALGFYFDAKGGVAYAKGALTLRAQDMGVRCRAAAVAVGASKAEAIMAVCMHHQHKLLVTDESAANRLLELLRA